MKIDNLILIKGGAYSQIKDALLQWIDLYSKDLKIGMTFQLFKIGSDSHLIEADKKLDNKLFYFLINYLKYPENIKYNIDIEGFTIGKDKDQLKNKELLVYIPQTDQEFDNVYITTSENKNFKVDFGGKITEIQEVKNYSYPTNLKLGLAEVIKVQEKINLNPQDIGSIIKLEKRFFIISIIVFSTFFLSYFFYQVEDDFLTINNIITFAVFCWLMVDYKILQVDRLYFFSVGLAITIFFYGLYLYKCFEENAEFLLITTTMPIFLLIIQRPLRLTFIRIMKREPKVEKPAPSVADFIYIFILYMITITVPVIYFKRLLIPILSFIQIDKYII